MDNYFFIGASHERLSGHPTNAYRGIPRTHSNYTNNNKNITNISQNTSASFLSGHSTNAYRGIPRTLIGAFHERLSGHSTPNYRGIPRMHSNYTNNNKNITNIPQNTSVSFLSGHSTNAYRGIPRTLFPIYNIKLVCYTHTIISLIKD